jgi:tetratricopeptide (TPR) repeat protein
VISEHFDQRYGGPYYSAMRLRNIYLTAAALTLAPIVAAGQPSNGFGSAADGRLAPGIMLMNGAVASAGVVLAQESGSESPDVGAAVGKPIPDTSPANGRAFVDELFHRLQSSNDPQEARGIAGVIERFWLRSGSDTADLLMSRAIAAMQAKEFDLALTLLGRIVELEPSWAEGWNKRATLRFEMDDLDGSMQDIQRVLTLEPRHFGALSGMGIILQREGLDKRALEAFRRVLEVYPAMESIKEISDKLALQVEGRGI